jgi:hypothetical protein
LNQEDEDRWQEAEPPVRGPSAPRTLNFNPFATGLAVFMAVAIPFVVAGYTRPAGVNTTIIAVGVVAGLVLGLIVGLWVDHRHGQVWKGPRL